MTITDGYHALAPAKVASVVTYVQMTERPAWIDAAYPGARELIPKIVAAADAFAGGFPQHDDMTLIVVRFL